MRASISAGSFHTCGLTVAGQAYCWGTGDDGRLGTGSTSAQFVPAPVAGGLTFATISAGARHTCGLTWGFNVWGQLGNLCLVIRFEREREERFAHWIGGESWRSQRALDRLFAEAEGGLDAGGETGVSPAPAETVALWVTAVASMGPDELESFERRTFAAWDRVSLGDLRRAIERRRKELTG